MQDVFRLKQLIVVIALAASGPALGAEADITALLRGYDQALLNAVHRGDRATWEKFTTPDFAYIEAAEILPREAFLKTLEEDGKQPLAIRSYGVKRIADTALVIHEDEVQVDPMRASRPGGRFLMTETWQRIGGDWKMRLVHIEPVRTDPPAVTLAPNELDALMGDYRAGIDALVIRRDGTRLVGTRPNQAEVVLLAETRDVFFTPGDTRKRRIFQRDPVTQAATGFILRGENSDMLYVRRNATTP